MTQKPFDLDTAIDAVAKQLTHVEHDPHLPARIASSLPERSSSWLGWWAPRLAMVAMVVAAGIVWGNRREVATPAALPLASSQSIATPTLLVASVREAAPDRTMPLERLEPLEPLERREPERSDFERSLPALGAVAALDLDSLAPVSLAEDAPLTLAPLAITDLPLTAEPISPR